MIDEIDSLCVRTQELRNAITIADQYSCAGVAGCHLNRARSFGATLLRCRHKDRLAATGSYLASRDKGRRAGALRAYYIKRQQVLTQQQGLRHDTSVLTVLKRHGR